ncbi:WSC domain-containing protein [Seiridium cupressi]
MLRFGCPQLVIDRIDPLINPGTIPSLHVHQIVGGNGFNASMTTSDVSATVTCTYLRVRNGTYKRVQQRGAALQFSDTYSNKMADDILVYYVSAQPGSIPAFKPVELLSLLHRSQLRADIPAPCQDNSIGTEALPTKACKGGIRSNIHFPTCWDGKNLDSPDHKSHVAYPMSGPATFLSEGGACPSTHPVRIPQLITGDVTGLGQHADYVFGWKGDGLQKAMNAMNAMNTTNCMGADLKTQQLDAATKCGVKRVVDEDHDGC